MIPTSKSPPVCCCGRKGWRRVVSRRSSRRLAGGTGRSGRLLIGWMLHRHLDGAVPPPVSVAFLRDIGGYLSGLTRYRSDGPDEWVGWFARTLESAATSANATLAAVRDL